MITHHLKDGGIVIELDKEQRENLWTLVCSAYEKVDEDNNYDIDYEKLSGEEKIIYDLNSHMEEMGGE